MTCMGGAGMGEEKQTCPACGKLVWTLHHRRPDGHTVCQSCAKTAPQYLVLCDPEEADYLLSLLEKLVRRWREHMASPTAYIVDEQKDLLKCHKFATEALTRLLENLELKEAPM